VRSLTEPTAKEREREALSAYCRNLDWSKDIKRPPMDVCRERSPVPIQGKAAL